MNEQTNEPPKARSRLQRKSKVTTEKSKPSSSTSQHTQSTLVSKVSPFLSRYGAYSQTLILALSSWLLLGYLLLRIYPESVQNWLIPHAYLPVLLVFFTANLFTFAFILLNTRRAFTVAAALTSFLLFRLQQIIFTPQLVLGTLFFFGILELALTMLIVSWSLPTVVTRKSRANIKQKTRSRSKRTRS